MDTVERQPASCDRVCIDEPSMRDVRDAIRPRTHLIHAEPATRTGPFEIAETAIREVLAVEGTRAGAGNRFVGKGAIPRIEHARHPPRHRMERAAGVEQLAGLKRAVPVLRVIVLIRSLVFVRKSRRSCGVTDVPRDLTA